ncbi:cAMP and cAMP-inhibited cGMP 3',5'-cyclic phosphodiesterase 10A-like [Tribolium madens]|uniref:cAMP and cAMP-inhibited cGMP 3',5'-cyclic phosphodiesterase 10A-like n=1 Tax=Tribolium madens TaxID=41895 RepID=UPI001CF75385|nr:cAMP and cAMP-inhibited cGMP 3',5'-cyclic phosphodiesterase 10A-like [Tribolium madens]
MAHMTKKRHVRQLKIKGNSKTNTKETNKPDKSSAWRVIAPFVTVPIKKTHKEVEDEQFSFYLKKKPAVLLQDLSTFMSDSVDLPSLFHETADVLQKVTKASWVTLYLVDRATNEIYVSHPNMARERHKVKWKIDEQVTVATYVAKKMEYVVVEDVLLDIRFPEGIGYDASTIPKSVMCIPIVTPDGDCFAVIEFVREYHMKSFVEDDLKICVMVTAWMGVAIHQNQERLALKRQQELNDYLLDLVKCYFEDHVLMEKLMSEVVKFAKITLGAERGSFFIIDKDSDEMIAHLFDEGGQTEGAGRKVRFSKERGIAGLVARTGQTVNIKDAYNDSRFNKEIDQKTGFITRSILCMPILGKNGVLGVVQVVNKKRGGCFSSNDENLFKTFSLYCSMAVHYTNIHSEIKKQTYLNKINLKVVKLQQVPCIHDMTNFINRSYVNIPVEFDNFHWSINNSDELMFLPQYTLYIMTQLISISEINLNVMKKFILTVRKFYRDLPYHNFEHAFSVCHCMYLVLKRNLEQFSKLEVKALLIASLCHDIDHPGFTNNFLQIIKDDITILYEAPALENHHWEVTKMVLNDHDIFPKMTGQERELFHSEIQKAILATDLSTFFQTRVTLAKLYNSKMFNRHNPIHRMNMKAIIMNACDFSGMAKPFLAAKRVVDQLYREFYKQGDLEKELGQCPLSVMDREKENCIPEDQIRFLKVVVIPCVEIIRVILPNCRELYIGALRLRQTWEDIVKNTGRKIWRQDDSIVNPTYVY